MWGIPTKEAYVLHFFQDPVTGSPAPSSISDTGACLTVRQKSNPLPACGFLLDSKPCPCSAYCHHAVEHACTHRETQAACTHARTQAGMYLRAPADTHAPGALHPPEPARGPQSPLPPPWSLPPPALLLVRDEQVQQMWGVDTHLTLVASQGGERAGGGGPIHIHTSRKDPGKPQNL